MTTYNALEAGDRETRSIYLGNSGDITDEMLSKWSAKVKDIEETNAKEAEELDELEDIMNKIESKIKFNGEYNSAIAMLEAAKKKYPDSEELKVFEAEVKDMLAKKGINMDGSKMETSEEGASEEGSTD